MKRSPLRTLFGLLLAPGLLGLPMTQLGCGSDFQVNTVVARVATDPGFIDFGVIPVGASGSTILQLTVDQGEAQVLAMEMVNVEGNFIDVDNTSLPYLDAGTVVTIEVHYAPTAEGLHWGELHIVTDAQEENEAIIQVRGEAKANLVRAYPSLIDFGPVQVGDSADRELVLVNEGQTDLTVESLDISNAVFTSSAGLPLDLTAGSRLTLPLTFSPTSLDAARAEVTVGFAEFTGLEPIDLRGNDCEAAAGDLYDQDGDGFGFCGGDCNDWDEDTNPAGTEVCDGFDNDCDGELDEDTNCSDDDGDGYSEYDGDCNDGDPMVGQHMSEIENNGIDDDCDGQVDDGIVDADGDGYSPEGGDCDDTAADTYPGANETPDGDDNDCDGVTDEGTTLYDDDGDGFTEVMGDCDDSDSSVRPGARETANWLDDDCDGRVDEGTDYGDDDGDGFSEVGGDCDDADATVSPGTPETIGDGIDNDCDGDAD